MGMHRDSGRARMSQARSIVGASPLHLGMIVHAYPYLHCYKVALSQGGWVLCTALTTNAGHIPLGPRVTSPYPPNSQVIVTMPPGLNYGIIMGVIPPIVFDGKVACPDWIAQGGGSGFQRELAHQWMIQNGFMNGGMHDFNSSRPIDATSLEKGWVTMLGGCLSLDDFMLMLRINEMCGVWFNIHDSATKLAGVQFTLESIMHEERVRDDEGEVRLFRGQATYLHEALGLYVPGVKLIDQFDDKDVQYTIHRGKQDLPKGKEDTQPVYRAQEYGGYLGQAFWRGVMKPAKEGGTRLRKDAGNPPDEGLFRETIGIDGSYTAISAKRYYIGKRCKQEIPWEIKLPEDGRGDDARAGGYKFASLFGSGPDHKIKDPKIEGDLLSMRRAAAVNDFAAYLVNWQGLHPFHYHTKDFNLVQESEHDQHFEHIQEILNFAEDSTGEYMPDPQPIQITIDPRYGDVNYFQRESFLCFHDDGTVQLGCGFGAQIVLGGGNIDLQAPHQVRVQAGTDVIVLASQIAARAKQSVDISATNENVHIKAENMVMILGGNKQSGGVLIESKAESEIQDYKNKFGEDVTGNGVVIKSANSVIGLLAQDIYLRTGGGPLGNGNIVLDAGQGTQTVEIYTYSTSIFFNDAVRFFAGATGTDGTVTLAYEFSTDQMLADVDALIGGGLYLYGDDAEILANGGISVTGSIACGGQMADQDGGLVGKVPQGFASKIEAALAKLADEEEEQVKLGNNIYLTRISEAYYVTERLGDNVTIGNIGFSFRDPPNGDQYKKEGLLWPEPRWQEMVRFNMATGGEGWTEKPVLYQGAMTYPYPGKDRWCDTPILLQLEQLSLFDADNGYDQDRPSPYEDPSIADWTRQTLDGTYKLIR